MDVIATLVKDINIKEINLIIPLVSENMRKKVENYGLTKNRIRSIIGQLIVTIYVIDKWSIPFREIEFIYNKYGKPSVKGCNYYYNISHSGDWVVVAFDTCPIGIDIELVRSIEYEELANRFFTPDEKQQLYKQSDSEKLNYFYKIWTLKESYIKALGRGLSIPLQSFSVRILDDEILLVLHKGDLVLKRYFLQYNIDHSYQLSICSTHSSFPSEVNILTWNTIIQRVYSLLM